MDANVFATVIAVNMNAAKVVMMDQNQHLFAPEKVLQGNERNEQNQDRLELRFNRPPKNDPTKGWQFGNNMEHSDVIVLPRATGDASEKYFTLSLTDDYSVWICSTSRHQITVSLHYKRSLDKKRMRTTHRMKPKQGKPFLICRPPHGTHLWSHFDILVGETAEYRVFFPNHTLRAAPEYMDNLRNWVNRFPLCLRRKDSTTSTTFSSRQSESPLRRQMFFRDPIGSGSFGLVELWVDLYTGYEAAMKTLKKAATTMNARQNPPSNLFQKSSHISSKGLYDPDDLSDFKKEIDVMRRCNHPHVITLFEAEELPTPRILMPYYRHGNIEQHHSKLQPAQFVRAFCQLLQGIQYLHEQREVAHRDLKPTNILVANIDPIHIVLSDFGLAKEASNNYMRTLCGTPDYCAPEMFSFEKTDQDVGYRLSVDMWSAGVILLQWMYKLPKAQKYTKGITKEWTLSWAEILVNEVKQHRRKTAADTDKIRVLALDLLEHMLVVDAGARYTASQCLEKGYENVLFSPTDSVATAATDSGDNMSSNPTTSPVEPPATPTTMTTGEVRTLAPDVAAQREPSKHVSHRRFMNYSGYLLLEAGAVADATHTNPPAEAADRAIRKSPDTPTPVRKPLITTTSVEQDTPSLLPPQTLHNVPKVIVYAQDDEDQNHAERQRQQLNDALKDRFAALEVKTPGPSTNEAIPNTDMLNKDKLQLSSRRSMGKHRSGKAFAPGNTLPSGDRQVRFGERHVFVSHGPNIPSTVPSLLTPPGAAPALDERQRSGRRDRPRAGKRH